MEALSTGLLSEHPPSPGYQRCHYCPKEEAFNVAGEYSAPMNLKELIERGVEIANAGLDPVKSAAVDAESLAEPLISSVFNALAVSCASDERHRLLTRQTKTITFTNGVGAVSADALTACLDDSVLTDPADPAVEYGYIPQWNDFIQRFDLRIGAYTVNQSVITVVEPNVAYDPSGGLSADRALLIPCVWAIPLDLTTDINIRAELLDDLCNRLGLALRGELLKAIE